MKKPRVFRGVLELMSSLGPKEGIKEAQIRIFFVKGSQQGPWRLFWVDFGRPLALLWNLLGSSVGSLGIPGGSLGTPGLIFGFFLEIIGRLLAPFWHPFGTFFRLSGSVAFFIDF